MEQRPKLQEDKPRLIATDLLDQINAERRPAEHRQPSAGAFTDRMPREPAFRRIKYRCRREKDRRTEEKFRRRPFPVIQERAPIMRHYRAERDRRDAEPDRPQQIFPRKVRLPQALIDEIAEQGIENIVCADEKVEIVIMPCPPATAGSPRAAAHEEIHTSRSSKNNPAASSPSPAAEEAEA